MKNKKLWIGAAITILIIISITFLTSKEKHFSPIGLDKKENFVIDRTDEKYMDTIVYIGLKELGIKNVVVTVRYIPNGTTSFEKDMDLYGYIIGGQNGQFIIFIKKHGSRSTNLHTLSHELIHLKQILKKDLIKVGPDAVYKNIVYPNANNIEYKDRVWEIDAELEGIELSKRINKTLYKKL